MEFVTALTSFGRVQHMQEAARFAAKDTPTHRDHGPPTRVRLPQHTSTGPPLSGVRAERENREMKRVHCLVTLLCGVACVQSVQAVQGVLQPLMSPLDTDAANVSVFGQLPGQLFLVQLASLPSLSVLF